jgi:nitrite reductase/ring-hydroxylating ferredoxin subunit
MSEAAAGRLCRIEEIEEGAARGFVIGSGAERTEIFVYRAGGRLFGYVNSCPHVGTPLDMAGDDFLTTDGSRFLCHTHGAQFRIADGLCVAGPCKGKRLKPVAVRARAGLIELV